MIALKLALALVMSPMPAPDCQRFCLGECHYDWRHHRCADTRVEYIGTADDIMPQGYEPAAASEFPAHWLPDPPDFGAYPTEKQSP